MRTRTCPSLQSRAFVKYVSTALKIAIMIMTLIRHRKRRLHPPIHLKLAPMTIRLSDHPDESHDAFESITKCSNNFFNIASETQLVSLREVDWYQSAGVEDLCSSVLYDWFQSPIPLILHLHQHNVILVSSTRGAVVFLREQRSPLPALRKREGHRNWFFAAEVSCPTVTTAL